jgi:phytoene dehydrogenase-like protein
MEASMKTFLIVKFALVPFSVFWFLLASGHPGEAIVGALALSAAGNAWRAHRGQFAGLEAGALALFVALGVCEVLAPGLTARNALWLSLAGLGAISLASVLGGRPWTADYSRLAFPDTAGTPQFRAINFATTGFWGVVFLVLAVCRYLQLPGWTSGAIVAPGVLVSIFGPRLAVRFMLNRIQAMRETYHWPAPALVPGGGQDCDVAIVGAGIGGLSAAAYLADAGLKVEVFDQHVVPGGYCHDYARKAHHEGKPLLYRFDAGPHDFSGVWQGGPVHSLLERLGVAGRLEWLRIDHTYNIGGERYDVPRDWRDYARMLGERFPESAAGIAALFEEIHAIWEDMYATGRGRGGIPGMPATADELMAYPSRHPHAFRWMEKPFDALIAAHVSDPRAIRVIYALSGYLGDGKEKLSCAAMVPIFGYYFKGGFHPAGGSGRFSEVLAEAIEARGGKVHLKTPVARILVEDGRAAGLVLGNGRTVRAQAVISNADMKRTLMELVGPKHLPAACRDEIAAAAPSTSAFTVHLGVDFVPDIRPAVHIHAPMPLGIVSMSRLDPSAAPQGHSTLALISIMPHGEAQGWFPAGEGGDWKAWRRSPEYLARKKELGDRMIAAAETVIPGLSGHIVYRTEASPVTYARYDWASDGAIYGISGKGRLNGTKSPVPGLVIAGGGNAGAGVEAVVISGAEAAETLVPGVLAGKPATEKRREPALAAA